MHVRTRKINTDLSLQSVDTWQKKDTTWVFALIGTAIGAGVLFFPIRAGYGGLWPIIIMLILAYPIAFFCHRALARLCLAGSGDIIHTVERYFGATGGIVITLAYFFAIYPLLFIYGVTLTNTFMSFWQVQLGLAPLNRGIVALIALISLAIVILFGKKWIVRIMSYLVFPLIICLILISLLLIPYWKSGVFTTLNPANITFWGDDGLLTTVWLGVALMVFSFSFAAIVSSFVVSQREINHSDVLERKCEKIISRACILMIFVVMFFSFSCLFTLSPADLAVAKARNIPILSYLAEYIALEGGSTTLSFFFEYAAPIIALIAVFKSFFGHYLGAVEGLNGLLIRFAFKRDRKAVPIGKLNLISMSIIMSTTWVIAYLNPNILDLIEAMGAPIVAFLLCLLPIYAVYNIPSMAKYRGQIANYFVMVVGILTYLNIIYKLM